MKDDTVPRLSLSQKSLLTSLPDSFRWSFSIWFLARIILLAWGVFMRLSGLASEELGKELGLLFGVSPVREGLTGLFLGVWQRWDAINYVRIAQYGYNSNDLTAFYPFYPWLASELALFTRGNYLLWLTVISNIAYLLALITFYKITEALFDQAIARRTIVATAFFPTAFFFFAPYPQSLSLFFVVFAYFLALKKKWKAVFVVSVLAGLTHSTVIPLILALLVEAYHQRQDYDLKGKAVAVIASFGSIFGVVGFLAWRNVQGFPAYSQMLEKFWGRTLQWPWQVFFNFPTGARLQEWLILDWYNILIFILAALLTLQSIRKLRFSLALYQVTMFLFLLATTVLTEPFASFGRYSLLMFPMFILLAHWSSTPCRRLIFLALGLSTQLYLAGQYFMWGWVY